MTINKPVIKEIKNRMTRLVDSNVNSTTRVDRGLQTMQAIDFLSRAV